MSVLFLLLASSKLVKIFTPTSAKARKLCRIHGCLDFYLDQALRGKDNKKWGEVGSLMALVGQFHASMDQESEEFKKVLDWLDDVAKGEGRFATYKNGVESTC